MNEYEKRQRLDLILRHLADEIDVSPTRYQEAKDHYNAVGEWLGRDDSELAPFLPVVFPQGSFVLGTAIRPIGDEEYDVDAVCLLQQPPAGLTQQQLKDLVGARLKHPQSRYRDMISPPGGGRRLLDDSVRRRNQVPSRRSSRYSRRVPRPAAPRC